MTPCLIFFDYDIYYKRLIGCTKEVAVKNIGTTRNVKIKMENYNF